jgi:hypothetical protein
MREKRIQISNKFAETPISSMKALAVEGMEMGLSMQLR